MKPPKSRVSGSLCTNAQETSRQSWPRSTRPGTSAAHAWLRVTQPPTVATSTRTSRSPRPEGIRPPKVKALPRSGPPRRGRATLDLLPLPVEHRDGEAVELLVGGLPHLLAHHLDARVADQPAGDVITHGVAIARQRGR